MSRAAPALRVAPEQRAVLEAVAASGATERARRVATALLLAADGTPNIRIATALDASPKTVRAWRAQFAAHGLNALGSVGAPRGRRRRIPVERHEAIIRATLNEPPPHGSRWTCRSMAAAAGVSPSTVQRVWAAHGISPPVHRPTGPSPTRQTADRTALPHQFGTPAADPKLQWIRFEKQ